MSVNSHHPRTYTCGYTDCENDVPPASVGTSAYCSAACQHRDRGARLLAFIDNRHELCGTCFRLTKDIERPPEEYLRTHFGESGGGYTRREGAKWSHDSSSWTMERYGQELTREAVVGFADPTEHAEQSDYGLGCRCGAIDHDIDDQSVRDTEAWEWWLQLATEYFREIGAREDTLRAPTVGHAYYRTGGDLPYAVGLALDV